MVVDAGRRGEMKSTESIPLLRRSSRVSTVPSNKWSPDHSTPVILLVPSADAQGRILMFKSDFSRGKNPKHEGWAHHHNRTRRPGLI